MKTKFRCERQFLGGPASLSAVGWESGIDPNGLPVGKLKLAWKDACIVLHSDVREGYSSGFCNKMKILSNAIDDIIAHLSSDEYWVFRKWLNDETSSFTGSIAAEVDLYGEHAVVEIADCAGKVRLHLSEFGVEEPIDKMKITLTSIRGAAMEAARSFDDLLQYEVN